MPPRSSSIEVSIRVRPMRPELGETEAAWKISHSTLSEIVNPDSRFTFDHVYDTTTDTHALYEECVRSQIVSRVVQGFNGTVFAYGQTGSGKSFTMLGGSTAQGSSPGLVSMAVMDVFRQIAEQQQQGSRQASSPVSSSLGSGAGDTNVYVSIVEIYNEQLRDLMLDGSSGGYSSSSTASPLTIRENEFGVYVHNAVRTRVHTAQECLELIRRRVASRVSGATAMNENSSRSHCIIRLHVERRVPVSTSDQRRRGATEDSSDEDDDAGIGGRGRRSQVGSPTRSAPMTKLIVSTLNLVDLAGSERVAKTGATGVRMVEGGHINKSLTTLTTVINRLTEMRIQQQRRAGGGPGAMTPVSSFVPYRDSRLTHLLKTAIGGNSYTCIFCCITPSTENMDESRSTLQFASRAKHIENRVQVNEVADPKVRVRELERHLRETKRLLVAQTLYLWSKEVRIKNLVAQLNSIGIEPITGGGRGGQSGSGALQSRQESMGPSGQQGAIIEQLTAEKDALQEALTKARAAAGSAAGPDGDKSTSTALQNALAEKQALRRSMDELDSLCRELEAESGRQAETIKRLESEKTEANDLVEAVDAERASLMEEFSLLKSQLDTTQKKLMEKHRGDAYLEELTKLHIEHQQLQHVCAQWKERHGQDTSALQQQVRKLDEKVADLDDEKEEAKEEQRLLNSYLWRFLSIASLAATGRVVQEPISTEENVPPPRLNAALRDLAQFVNQKQTLPAVAGPAQAQASSAAEVRIRELETELVSKDALRDVIVDSKLKRMQELVLRLYAMNQALVAEMRACFTDNEQIFQITDSHTRVASELSSVGLFPRSFADALSRARYAQAPVKPFGHN